MSETTDYFREEDTTGAEPSKPVKGRPKGSGNRLKKRQYAHELTELQSRVNLALMMLQRLPPANADSLLALAIDTLKGAE